LLLWGIPALLVAGVLHLEWEGGLPHLSLDRQRAQEIRHAAREELGKINPDKVQEWENSAKNLWNTTQASYQYPAPQAVQQQSYPQQGYQQQSYPQQSYPQQSAQQQGYPQQSYQQPYAQPTYAQPTYQQPQPYYSPQQTQPPYYQPQQYQSYQPPAQGQWRQ